MQKNIGNSKSIKSTRVFTETNDDVGFYITRVSQINYLGKNFRKLEVWVCPRSPAKRYNVEEFDRNKIKRLASRSSALFCALKQ